MLVVSSAGCCIYFYRSFSPAQHSPETNLLHAAMRAVIKHKGECCQFVFVDVLITILLGRPLFSHVIRLPKRKINICSSAVFHAPKNIKKMKFLNLFGRLKSVVIGMIHVKALPGTPLGCLKISQITDEACREAEIYLDAGIDGLIVENMHDVPYSFSVGPEVCACMTAVCSAVRRVCPTLPLGVQILSSANQQALAVALASGLDFIRAEGFVFSHVADEGLLNACAGDLLRYRRQIGADNVQIFTDIKKKHSSHALTSDVNIKETAQAAEFFLSDGLVITGAATGEQADPRELREVSQSVRIPVLIGSGVTYDNVESFLDAHAVIVGSHFKSGGHWVNAVDPDKVKRFMTKIRDLRQ